MAPFDPPSQTCAWCSSPVSRDTGFHAFGDDGTVFCCRCMGAPDKSFTSSRKKAGGNNGTGSE